MREKMNIEGLVVQQLCNPEIDIFSQPIIDLQNNCKNCANLELLSRFYSCGEMIPPNAIFGNPHNQSLLEQLDLEIFQKSINRLDTIITNWKYNNNYQVGINVSEKSVYSRESFLDKIYSMTHNSSVNPNNIYLEISEKGDNGIDDFVSYAQELGFGIAIDDIGTQNFTISKLRNSVVPFISDLSRLKVKIDQSFIRKLIDNTNKEQKIDEAFVNMIMAFKETYPEVGIVAEGIEDKTTALYLRDKFGIKYGQGFYWEKPSSFDQNYKQPNNYL